MAKSKRITSSTMASGSYGLTASHGQQTLRVWFCGRTIHPQNPPDRNVSERPCVHTSRDEARRCSA